MPSYAFEIRDEGNIYERQLYNVNEVVYRQRHPYIFFVRYLPNCWNLRSTLAFQRFYKTGEEKDTAGYTKSPQFSMFPAINTIYTYRKQRFNISLMMIRE